MRSPECPVCLRSLAQDTGRLMEARDTRRRRSRHRMAATNAAALRLVGAPVLPAEAEAPTRKSTARHELDATAAFLSDGERGSFGNADDDEDHVGCGCATCVGAAWSWLWGTCTHSR